MGSGDVEVLGLGVVHDDGRRGLLRVELELLAELDPDPLWFQERKELGLVLEVGARRVAEAVPRTPVSLAEDPSQVRGILPCEAITSRARRAPSTKF